jgi:hypothetical protein
LLGKLAIVTGGPHPDGHDWGGLYDIVLCHENVSCQYWGDFLETV